MSSQNRSDYLADIKAIDKKIYNYYNEIIKTDKNLSRMIVSFQGNKNLSSYRWYKYKEAFSASLVRYLLSEYNIPKGIILDPFAGSGTTLFASSEIGYNSEGIELLPIGQQIIKNRMISKNLTKSELFRLSFWKDKLPWKELKPTGKINTLRITDGAYPEPTEKSISKFLNGIKKETPNIRSILFFALLCILESISYTRKDGQCLRWDYRAGRKRGKKKFDKGIIYTFEKAITSKLSDIINDIKGKNIHPSLFNNMEIEKTDHGIIKLYSGSCLNILPNLDDLKYQSIVTSPPYCNRYDYTRTYALEHALMGIGEQELSDLRQKMLSCTVENKEKSLSTLKNDWLTPIQLCQKNELLKLIIEYLEYKKSKNELNNNGIPRMIKGYFYEMACVIMECHRVLKDNGIMFMVNDNVRYAGASVPVDLILSKIAEHIGFTIDNILILPIGKGNSSQQMGLHGREVLRKCVYVWRKTNAK